ncbi:hypothetical protein AYO47_03845 [Planctomyces sp. SCGC AG-212-M04]|nr:hypothetical protein AYO47_03845 [Planctomyces sp. SCGC AG-212-M04]
MAVEQLKYDFELNLSKAERQLDQFVNKAEQKLNRVSDGLEKKMATATKGGSRGDGTADLERRLRAEDRIIERYELNRIRRREQIKAKEMSADLRADQLQKKAVSRFGDDPVLLDKALSARKRYESERAQIIREGSLKNSAILQTELKRAEVGYRSELDGLGPKGKKGGRSGRYGMLNSLAFGAQQAVEDYNYAGFRGLSNNLAFMGAIIPELVEPEHPIGAPVQMLLKLLRLEVQDLIANTISKAVLRIVDCLHSSFGGLDKLLFSGNLLLELPPDVIVEFVVLL